MNVIKFGYETSPKIEWHHRFNPILDSILMQAYYAILTIKLILFWAVIRYHPFFALLYNVKKKTILLSSFDIDSVVFDFWHHIKI